MKLEVEVNGKKYWYEKEVEKAVQRHYLEQIAVMEQYYRPFLVTERDKMKIYKQVILETGVQELTIDGFVGLLKFAEQNGELVLWYLMDEQMLPSDVKIEIFGTGHENGDIHIGDYFDTVQMNSGLVWHIFVQIK